MASKVTSIKTTIYPTHTVSYKDGILKIESDKNNFEFNIDPNVLCKIMSQIKSDLEESKDEN